ncbi:hypothetical protein [Nocardia sp. NPDC052566]|uniref:hypothetical protein n=1 Tax=Nocardia sp. NPDC052566 TaxID=3364330 RepID=UPI0037CBC9E8
MSITFTTEMSPVIGYAVLDYVGGREEFDNYEDALQRLQDLREHGIMLDGFQSSGDPDEDQINLHYAQVEPIQADPAPEVDMCSDNARRVCEVLDVQVWDAEPLPIADFLGRVLIALGVAPADEGMPAYELAPRWIEFGRRPGHLQAKLEELRDLAQWATGHNRTLIFWG